MADGEVGGSNHAEGELLGAAYRFLSCRLPPRWSATKRELDASNGEMELIIRDGNRIECMVFVEAKSAFSPRDAKALSAGLPRRLRDQSEAVFLVVAPYINPRTRDHLRAESISYIDATGNVRIVVDRPGLFIETQGLQRDPYVGRASTRLGGERSGAVVRLLVDVVPPYTAVDLATATSVNEGYVSRILGILLEEGLIDRPRRGPVTDVDWEGVILRRAQSVDLFTRRGSHRFSAPLQSDGALACEALADTGAVVSGPFAAERLSPAVSPSLLVAYTKDPRGLASSLRRGSARETCDVLLIHPEHPTVFDRVQVDRGVAYAAPSQIAIDCLACGGVVASHGVAVLEWMRDNETRWRLPSIEALFESIPPLDGHDSQSSS